MLSLIKLILPVIFPSWRFFSSIGPSPRIYVAFLQAETDEPQAWQLFRPKPARISFIEGVRRLFLNTQWNETLYINTCAERLFEAYSPMREQEIMQHLLVAAKAGEIAFDHNQRYMIFRITAVMREQKQITEPVVFISKPKLLPGFVEWI